VLCEYMGPAPPMGTHRCAHFMYYKLYLRASVRHPKLKI